MRKQCSSHYFREWIEYEHVARWALDGGGIEAGVESIEEIRTGLTSTAMTWGSISTMKLCLDRSGSLPRRRLTFFLQLRNGVDVVRIFELLLNAGLPINRIWPCMRPDIEQGTLLFQAAVCGRDDIVSWLLSRGSDPTVVSSWGRTALEASQARSHNNVTEVLRKWGHQSRKAPSTGGQMDADLYKIQSAFNGQ